MSVGAGNDQLDINAHNHDRLLDDNHNLSVVDGNIGSTKKGSIAAGVLGAATAQFSATKVCQVVNTLIC